jgi:hypothetical protein
MRLGDYFAEVLLLDQYYVIGDGLNPTVAELTEAAAVAGTGKPLPSHNIEISGLWIYGANTSITEESPFHALPWWRGRNQSNAECLARRTCAGW